MAIKTETQGSIPSFDIDHLHFTQTNISISEAAPHRIAISAKIRPYGLYNGEHFYQNSYENINITDLHAFIAGLVPADQARAAQAMGQVQAGLGVLAELSLGINFVEVE